MSGFAATDSANARWVPPSMMASSQRLYVLRCQDKAAHTCSSRCAIPYTQPRTCISACQQTRVHALFIPVHNAIVHSTYKRAHSYALIRAGYALHSLKCLECGVADKHCSNVLRSLRAYGVSRRLCAHVYVIVLRITTMRCYRTTPTR
jgi:hypothetical protein